DFFENRQRLLFGHLLFLRKQLGGVLESLDLECPVERWTILGRQIAHFHDAPCTDDRQPLDQVGELADVAGPWTKRKCAEDAWGKLHAATSLRQIRSDAVAHQQR